jgi:hypothetical protein
MGTFLDLGFEVGIQAPHIFGDLFQLLLAVEQFQFTRLRSVMSTMKAMTNSLSFWR